MVADSMVARAAGRVDSPGQDRSAHASWGQTGRPKVSLERVRGFSRRMRVHRRRAERVPPTATRVAGSCPMDMHSTMPARQMMSSTLRSFWSGL